MVQRPLVVHGQILAMSGKLLIVVGGRVLHGAACHLHGHLEAWEAW